MTYFNMTILHRNFSRLLIPQLNFKFVNIFKTSRLNVTCEQSPGLPNTSRFIYTSSPLFHGEFEWKDPKSEEEIVSVTFVDKDGNKNYVQGKVGDNLMYLAHRHEIEMEGACEASLACTTCHCYVEGNFISKLPYPEEKEEDLLDLAPFLKENSRLGCQIILTKELNGIEIHLPKATRNFYVDGHKPKPH